MKLAIGIVLVTAALGQERPARVEFEVVSVKPGDPLDLSSSGASTPGGMQMRNATLATIVRGAYGLNEFQLDGGPKWINSDKFNIDAKLPAGATREQIPLMMRTMLADRFHLEAHRETRQLKEYALVVAKGGPKLQVPTEEDRKLAGTSQGDRMIRGRAQPMATLAQMLISAAGAPVVDRTELTGEYNFDIRFLPLLSTPRENETLPTVFAALQEKLGLRLDSIKGPVEVLVIDKVEKPTEN